MAEAPSSKQAAGIAAAELVETGMIIGLGTGTTVSFFLEALAARINQEGLDVVGVATSVQTAERAVELGIPISDLEHYPALDLAVDGADEVDSEFRLIKGGGGALLREKIVAAASAKVAIIIGGGKRVTRLGTTFLLPVEVIPFGHATTRGSVAAIGNCTPYLRTTEEGGPFVTDNGNYILDCRFADGIANPEQLHANLSQIPGIAEVGLFLNLCDIVFEGQDNGEVVILNR